MTSLKRIACLVVVAAATSSVAQEYFSTQSYAQPYSQNRTGQAKAPAQTGNITVTGVVVNSVTGEPVSFALVQLMGMASRVALTDGEGRFEFDNLPETQASFNAHKPGYFSDSELHQGPHRMDSIRIASGMDPVTLKLTPAGIITGRVTTPDGEPVESSFVSLKARMVQNGRRQIVPRSGTSTDEDGYFRIGNLQPGIYYLYTNGNGRTYGNAEEVFSPAYYPGVADLSGASALEVKAGFTTVADMVVHKEKAYRVSGIVTGLLPNQIANVELLGPDGENVSVQPVFRPDANTFELRRVPAGSYTLKVFAQERMAPGQVGTFVRGAVRGSNARLPQTYSGSVPITVRGDLSNVSVSIQPAATIPIVVHTDFNNKKDADSGFSLAANQRRFQQYVSLHLVRTDGQRGDNYAQMTGGPDNPSFVVQNVEPGRYRVEFMPGGNYYVRSATYGNTDVLRDELVVSGGDSQPIDVVVRDDPATLSGTARCDETQCWVLIVPDGTSAIQPQTAFVNPQGNFQQMGLAPGSYRIYAFDRVDGIEYTNPEAMKAYSAHAETVVLSAGQKAQVNVDLTKVSDQ